MKKIFYLIVLVSILCSSCGNYIADFTTQSCNKETVPTTTYSKSSDLEKIMDEVTKSGVPGIVIAVQSSEGDWASARGYARIEDKTPMQLCHLQYIQSISKTYMAVAILKLYEQGKIKLDDPMFNYLPKKFHHYIPGADKVTVRMLLNHTSGIPEYNFEPAYVSYLLQHPDHIYVPEDYLRYIKGKEMVFTPGSKYVYTNTNFVLLALIADEVSGDHGKLISESIFQPVGLTNTFYRNEANYLQYPMLVNSYWDRHSDGIIENVSQLQKTNVSTLVGDDGIVTTPSDAIKFLKALAEGKILADATLKEMQTWTTHKNGKPAYGLGLTYKEINGVKGFGHSGGGIGSGCELYYFPEKNTCFFIAINLGTVTSSPLHTETGRLLEELHDVLVR